MEMRRFKRRQQQKLFSQTGNKRRMRLRKWSEFPEGPSPAEPLQRGQSFQSCRERPLELELRGIKRRRHGQLFGSAAVGFAEGNFQG